MQQVSEMKKIFIVIIVMFFLFLQYQKTVHVDIIQSLDQKVIVIDPGHGGLDNGASFKNVNEDELNLKISYALKEELESKGATVYLTRTDDQDMTKRDYMYSKNDDMYLRARAIDGYHPDLFISIHLNSAHAKAWGSQVFYYPKSAEGKILAESIHLSMKDVTGTKKKIMASDFFVLRSTSSLGVLIECGFLSNGNERGQLKNRSYHKKLAKAITLGIEDYFSYKV